MLGATASAGYAQAQTATDSLNDLWVVICDPAVLTAGSALAATCTDVISTGTPGSGGRAAAATAGNNLGVTSAQGRVSTAASIQTIEGVQDRIDAVQENGGGSGDMELGPFSAFLLGKL